MNIAAGTAIEIAVPAVSQSQETVLDVNSEITWISLRTKDGAERHATSAVDRIVVLRRCVQTWMD